MSDGLAYPFPAVFGRCSDDQRRASETVERSQIVVGGMLLAGAGPYFRFRTASGLRIGNEVSHG